MIRKTFEERKEEILAILKEEGDGLSCLNISKKMGLACATARVYLHRMSKEGCLKTYTKNMAWKSMGKTREIKTTHWRLNVCKNI